MAPPSQLLRSVLSRGTRSPLLVVAAALVALLVLLGLAQALAARDFRVLRESFLLSAQDQNLEPQRVLSRAYDAAGLRFFYSDGTLSSSKADVDARVLLNFTGADLACQMGNAARKAAQCKPGYTLISARSWPEDSLQLVPSATCSEVSDLIQRPVALRDCDVRLGTGTYGLRRACLVLRAGFEVPSPAAPQRATLVLPKASEATARALMLLRPTFVATPQRPSALYRVEATSLAYDSQQKTPVRLPLVEVDPSIQPPMWNAPRDNNSKLAAAAPVDRALLMIYPRYLARVQPASQLARTTPTFTLYLQLTPQLLAAPAPGARGPAPPPPAWALPNVLTVSIPYNAASSREVVVTAGSAKSAMATLRLPATPGACIVVTYTHTALLVAWMTGTRTIVRTFDRLPQLNVDRRAAQAVADKGGLVFRAQPPLPYDNFCVPNWAHIAEALGFAAQ